MNRLKCTENGGHDRKCKQIQLFFFIAMLKKRTGRVGDFFKWDDAGQPVVEARCPR
jgi:hypothetical protein